MGSRWFGPASTSPHSARDVLVELQSNVGVVIHGCMVYSIKRESETSSSSCNQMWAVSSMAAWCTQSMNGRCTVSVPFRPRVGTCSAPSRSVASGAQVSHLRVHPGSIRFKDERTSRRVALSYGNLLGRSSMERREGLRNQQGAILIEPA